LSIDRRLDLKEPLQNVTVYGLKNPHPVAGTSTIKIKPMFLFGF